MKKEYKTRKFMSTIIVPAKPNWKITITLDTANRPILLVEDQMKYPIEALKAGVQRQMNQLELALVLSNIVSSLIAQTLQISQRKNGGTTEDQKNHS
jgi:hypothetical protein